MVSSMGTPDALNEYENHQKQICLGKYLAYTFCWCDMKFYVFIKTSFVEISILKCCCQY